MRIEVDVHEVAMIGETYRRGRWEPMHERQRVWSLDDAGNLTFTAAKRMRLTELVFFAADAEVWRVRSPLREVERGSRVTIKMPPGSRLAE